MAATEVDLLSRIAMRIRVQRSLRDDHGWPEPRTVEDLRNDPRVQLCNAPDGGAENLELAAALILMVAEDCARLERAIS